MNLLTHNSAKTIKGLNYGVYNYILYLAPHTLNDKRKNLCPSSTKGCRDVCLYASGRGVFNNVQQSRINKANLFVNNLDEFKMKLLKEITNVVKKHTKKKEKFCIRLNGTSDIMYENIKFTIGNERKNIFELFPKVDFVDYTKILGRSKKQLPKNYYLVYSFNGNNLNQVKDLLEKGNGVSVVFKDKLPKRLGKYKVIDGDKSDLRHLDRKLFRLKKSEGYIIGLVYKKNKIDKDVNTLENNDFIYDPTKHQF